MNDFNKLSTTGKAFIVLFASYGAILIATLWLDAWANEIFVKVTITYVVTIILLAIIYLIRREFIDDEKAKTDKFMD